MNIFSFSAHFSSEADCRNHFKSERDKVGVICSRCGSDFTGKLPQNQTKVSATLSQ